MSTYNLIQFHHTRFVLRLTLIFVITFSLSHKSYSKLQYFENNTLTTFSDTLFNLNRTFFPVVFTGNGIDHMNINLVDLKHTGLKNGDEIGVFDGIYCVGSAILNDLDIKQNVLSIPASTNDTIVSHQNGFIPGHIVTLKLYRQGIVYPLPFQLVNNSKSVFESKGTMFALVENLNTESQKFFLRTDEVKIYSGPSKEILYIVIDTNRPRSVNCEIYDSNGKLVTSVINGQLVGEKIFVWDGKDHNNQKINPGIYYLRTNNLIKKLVLWN